MAHSIARGTPGTEARTLAWLYKDSQTGEVLGPSVIETLCTLWRCGELTEESQVKPEGAARFVRIRDAPALLGMLQTQPPSPAALGGFSLGGAGYGLGRAGRDALDWAELTRARAQLEADVAEFERWRSETLKLIAAQRALLSTSF